MSTLKFGDKVSALVKVGVDGKPYTACSIGPLWGKSLETVMEILNHAVEYKALVEREVAKANEKMRDDIREQLLKRKAAALAQVDQVAAQFGITLE